MRLVDGPGLDYAHAQNVLHRDLKPANILLDPERGPLLTDSDPAREQAGRFATAGEMVEVLNKLTTPEEEPAEAILKLFFLGPRGSSLTTGRSILNGPKPCHGNDCAI